MKRDHYGRYLLPHPDTGVEQAWIRVTTLAKVLGDRWALEQWQQRMVVHGIGQRADLYALAAGLDKEDRQGLQDVAKQALDAAQAQSRANLGTAVHSFAEQLDRGDIELSSIPEPMRSDVEAYQQATAHMEHVAIEQVVCDPRYEAVGTCDRFVRHEGQVVTLDIKTGRTMDFGQLDIAVQLTLYAGATHWWDGDAWHAPKGEVSQVRGIIAHVPAGEGTCTLYEVDLAAGVEAVEMSHAVRQMRKRTFLTPLAPTKKAPEIPAPNIATTPKTTQEKLETEPEEYVNDTTLYSKRFAWLHSRVEAIKAAESRNPEQGESPKTTLGGIWDRDEVPPFPVGGPRNEQEIDRAAAWCSLVEMTHSLPFADPDPATPVSKPNKG